MDEDRNEDDESNTHTRSMNKEGTGAGAGGQGDKPFNARGSLTSTGPLPRVVGWETNER